MMKNSKKINIYDFLKKRPLSWSAISSFEWDPEQWYKRYILGVKDKPTPELEFGKMVADSLATDAPMVPFEQYSILEQKLFFKFGGIQMVGYIDTFTSVGWKFREFKTGKKEWTQKRANEHGQLKFYTLGIGILWNIKPEDITVHLDWAPTEEGWDVPIQLIQPIKMQSFPVKITTKDLEDFKLRILKTVGEMQRYIDGYPVDKSL